MQLSVGISTSDLKRLDHRSASLAVGGGAELSVLRVPINSNAATIYPGSQTQALGRAASGEVIRLDRKNSSNSLFVTVGKRIFKVEEGSVLFIKPLNGSGPVSVHTLKRAGGKGKAAPAYRGVMVARAYGNSSLRLSLILDIDDYLRGVLQSEIPASYHAEAIKAQAVAARTYSLNPRVDHRPDGINVCDSYLCCQYFGGLNANLSSAHRLAISATSNQILTYEDKPILALFSSNAGGHTESYENCFSDPHSNAFPPQAIPYLVGVSEAQSGFKQPVDMERYLRRLWTAGQPKTVDSWSHHFKWNLSITGNQLESHLHNNIAKLSNNKESAPFIVAPSTAKFGHINNFKVLKRGVSGSIIEILISTSKGDWLVKKELVIRDFFSIPGKVKRLKSSRFYFDVHRTSGSGLISSLSLKGLGWGHGVGLQQTGAQGWAKAGLDYRKILAHYYQHTNIERA